MRLAACTLFLLALSSIPARNADAAWMFTLQEVGPDVVLTGKGTIDVTGAHFGGSAPWEAGLINPYQMVVGALDQSFGIFYADITGPSSIGPGPGGDATGGTGDFFGVTFPHGGLMAVLVPFIWHPGDRLSGTAIFSDQTFASLGITPGHYEWTMPSGDTITLSTVPEPTSMALLGTGLLALVGYRWRRRAPDSRLQ